MEIDDKFKDEVFSTLDDLMKICQSEDERLTMLIDKIQKLEQRIQKLESKLYQSRNTISAYDPTNRSK